MDFVVAKRVKKKGLERSPSEALEDNTILIGPIHTSELVLYQNRTKELVQNQGSYWHDFSLRPDQKKDSRLSSQNRQDACLLELLLSFSDQGWGVCRVT